MRSDLDFERLVDQHYATLYRFAASLCGNESDAADMVQQTYYLLATRNHQIADVTKVKSWLFTTLYRMFLGRQRRSIRFVHQELSEVEHDLPEVPPPPTTIDWESVARSLTQLDETFRAPIALFYLEDHSYGEIAEILDVPLGTVKSRIARGIRAMQRMLMDRISPGEKRA